MGRMVNATPRPLYRRARPVTHCIGGWVGPRAGLNTCGKSRPYQNSDPGPYSHSESLYRLSYPAHVHLLIYCKSAKLDLEHTNFALISFYTTPRIIADLKVGDFGDVSANCMEWHIVLKRQSFCRSSRRQVARTLTSSIWLDDPEG